MKKAKITSVEVFTPDELEKARRVTPIGGITPKGYKKVAEDQYVKIESEGGKQMGLFAQPQPASSVAPKAPEPKTKKKTAFRAAMAYAEAEHTRAFDTPSEQKVETPKVETPKVEASKEAPKKFLKWLDAAHTIHEPQISRIPANQFKSEMNRRRAEHLIVQGNTYPHKEIIKAAGGVWDSWEKQWLVPDLETRDALERHIRTGGKRIAVEEKKKPDVKPDVKPEVKSEVKPVAKDVEKEQEQYEQVLGVPATALDLQNLKHSIYRALTSAVGEAEDKVILEKLGLHGLVNDYGNMNKQGEAELAKLNKLEVQVLSDACIEAARRLEPVKKEKQQAIAEQQRAFQEKENIAKFDAGKFPVYCGEGYGGTPYVPGTVMPTKYGLGVVVKAFSRYVREDGMSFGVGDEDGYIFSAHLRRATPAEESKFLAEKAAKELVITQRKRVADIGTLITKNGERPEKAKPQGTTYFESEGHIRIYGGGSWFVVEPDNETVWYVRNNGADGDDWSHNNVETGGAGAIGWKMKSKELAEELKTLHEHLKKSKTG